MIDRHGSWPSSATKAARAIPPSVHAIICQTVVAHAIIGFLNASVLRAIRKLPSPALQEKIAKSLMISLAIGDVLHLFGMFYGIGDVRWKTKEWPQVLWLSLGIGITLFIPRCVGVATTPSPREGNRSYYRICWLLGIGRYVAARDSTLDGKS